MLWSRCGFALALLAVLTVWRLELVLGDWLRETLRSGGWYPQRRPLQAAALVLSVCLGGQLLRHALPAGVGRPLLGGVAGTSLLMFILWARLLSWHPLDAVLNFRCAGVSTGRWLEAAGLLVVTSCAAWQMRAVAGSR